MSQYTRRRLIATGLSAASISAISGCLGGGGSNSDATAQASFFVFGDFASEVAGDVTTAETLVPVGQHGHGWEPGPQIQGTIRESDLFIYGMEGFQPWADDIVTTLRDDDADVSLLAAGSGIDRLEGGHDHGTEHEEGHDEEHDHEDEHETGTHEGEHDHEESLSEHSISHACGHMEGSLGPEAEPLVAASSQGDASTFSQTHQPYAVELTEGTSYVTFEPESGDTGTYAFFTDTPDAMRPIETSVVHDAQGVEDCDAIEEYVVVESETGAVTIELTGGAGTVVTLLAEGVSDDHAAGTEDGHGHEGEHESEGEHGHEEEHETGAHEGEHDHETGTHEGEDGHGHDHSGEDPHFWLDPARAKQAVSTIRSGFVDVDGDNASAYADNAESYRSRLDELDSSFQSTLDNASKDIVFVAGHNAFQYLGQRYGFEVETLTGLSPDDQPTPQDIERAQEIIAEHDLEYVCADPLESQQAANQLVAETDATEVLPLTPIPGQTQEWADKDWGYVEIMENVNLETLRTALDA